MSADVLAPDGAGVVWAADLLCDGPPLEQIPGVELVNDILEMAASRGDGVYFLGAAPGVAEKAARVAGERVLGLLVAGTRHGYFSAEEEAAVITDIRRAAPAVLLVALGVPRQEHWMVTHSDELPVRLMIGVGGTFDVLSGHRRRAPDVFQHWGLEWLYRLFDEPSRIRRMVHLPLFVIEVLRTKIMGGFDAPSHKA
jgi:N-acetylglucosaminyldiphosphoundecaprenol N-acetyl-beta-D-mannosaminyltransferase